MENIYGIPVHGSVEGTEQIVKTHHGYVRGQVRDKVAIFRGIPYGGLCDKEHRFLPATEAADWEGIYDCTKNSPYAVQLGESIAAANFWSAYWTGGHPELYGCEDEYQDENCLFLNVITPGVDDKKRAVIFYMHGGGLNDGSGSAVTGADRLVKEQDVVVVGVNHRLNVFGYLYLGDLDDKYKDSGLAGFTDLVLALKWVQRNIEAFGGDPEKVTIMGESGGGCKVNTLMQLKEAEGLFRYAIVSSGSMSVNNFSKEMAAEQRDQLFASLGLKKGDLEGFLKLPARTIEEARIGHDIKISPVADDEHLAYIPGNYLKPTELSRKIPLLVGASEDELAAFAPDEAFDVSWETLIDKLCAEKTDMPGSSEVKITREAAEEIVAEFKKCNVHNDNAVQTYMKIISLAGPLGCTSHFQAKARAEEDCAPTYQYCNRYDVYHLIPQKGKYAWHTSEIPLMMRAVLYADSEPISHTWGQVIGAFARNGNPSIEGLEWPAYDRDHQKVMVIDRDFHVERSPLQAEYDVLEKWGLI